LGWLEAAAEQLETVRHRKPYDCELDLFLGKIAIAKRSLSSASDLLAASASCLEHDQQKRRDEIDQIRETVMTPQRRQRLIEHREQDLARVADLAGEAWFNAAECALSLGKPEDVRRFVAKIADRKEYAAAVEALQRRVK
jgi:hypothetical protein